MSSQKTSFYIVFVRLRSDAMHRKAKNFLYPITILLKLSDFIQYALFVECATCVREKATTNPEKQITTNARYNIQTLGRIQRQE